MTAKQYKSRIKKVLDELSEQELQDTLHFILKRQKNRNALLQNHLERIIKEDKNLLQRLAQ